ncbi:MAG: helix-turn-helix transcriptional regulator [Clostridia bacterium]|nr:helix-turn-helix transcriptional regulator [Clostridia bacterium]
MLFKERIKQFRAEKNLTQNDLADKLFVSRTLISKWENGVVYPNAQNMAKLAELMNVEVTELLSEQETKMLVLDNNSDRITVFQKIIYIISLILISSGLTLLIIGFIFPNDLTRPEDIYNSVNTITVICFIMKIIGGIMALIGLISSIITTVFIKR